MKTECKNGNISFEIIDFTAEEKYLKACLDEELCFYDLKLISEHFLAQKKLEHDSKNAVGVRIPQLTIIYKPEVTTMQI